MCGIAGFLGNPGQPEDLARSIRTMSDSLRHRGPDDGGVWEDAPSGVALGHRRLSIVDLSAEGHQPMISACGRYVLTFNGEIYNHRALREEMLNLGCRFRGTSDTEVMLAAIARWGVRRSVEQFNGMFAFAVWDREERRLTLARDRAGEKPLYYARFSPMFLFGSELKALRSHPAFEAEVDRGSLALYLRYGYVPAPYTIFRGVRKLAPGCLLTVRSGGVEETETYWSAREIAERGVADPFRGTEADAAAGLDSLLGDAVRMRMAADVPLGAFLSGGIDSSAVVALMQAASRRPVRTFTIGFHESHYNEAEKAKMVARHLGTEHTELYITPGEALALIPRLPAIYDEPFADSSQVPTCLVAELARRHVTVSLSGDGGDELFGGYTRYLWGSDIWRRTGSLQPGVRRLLARALTTSAQIGEKFSPNRRWVHRAFKLAEMVPAGRRESLYHSLVSQWKDPAGVVLGAAEPATPLTDPDAAVEFGDFAQRMMYYDTVTYLPDDILVKMDRATMAVSLEARVPMLDHRLIEFAWRLPACMKIRQGQGKWILRQILYKYVPKRLVERPKMGFAVPIDEWLRGPLREWASDLLAEDRLRREGFFQAATVRQKWSQHLAGSRNWQHDLWTVLMFQAWLEGAGKPVSPAAYQTVSP